MRILTVSIHVHLVLFTVTTCSLSIGNINVISSAGLLKQWMTVWRKFSPWDMSTGRDVQAVCTHYAEAKWMFYPTQTTPLLCAVMNVYIKERFIMWSILSTWKNFMNTMCVSVFMVPLFPSAALPKEYQRIGKAFQNLSSVFTSSGYQGTKYKYYFKYYFECIRYRHLLVVFSLCCFVLITTVVAEMDAVHYAVICHVEIWIKLTNRCS